MPAIAEELNDVETRRALKRAALDDLQPHITRVGDAQPSRRAPIEAVRSIGRGIQNRAIGVEAWAVGTGLSFYLDAIHPNLEPAADAKKVAMLGVLGTTGYLAGKHYQHQQRAVTPDALEPEVTAQDPSSPRSLDDDGELLQAPSFAKLRQQTPDLDHPTSEVGLPTAARESPEDVSNDRSRPSKPVLSPLDETPAPTVGQSLEHDGPSLGS
jgi:hypothetical protein